ncbi:reeler domain containing 1 [Brachyhypopomus gauderio]|uniref:reeler domain containing 1 n=1 Tax=Brachyhypopomus gauderio TaxID=698409 RepID=UPI0040427414
MRKAEVGVPGFASRLDTDLALSYGMTRLFGSCGMMRVMVMKAVLVVCVWMSWEHTGCVCFSHGASSASCVDMKPGHIGAHLQYTHLPSTLTIHTSRGVYLPLHTLMVSVRSSRAFMGLLLQARSVPGDHVVGGEFTLHPPGTHTLSCLSTGDTVTHSDKLLKRNLSFTWRAPSQPSGDLRFYITVVYSYFVYGARIRSSVVHDGTRSVQSAGYGSALPTRILSASFMRSTDIRIHTSVHNTLYSQNTTARLINNLPTHTLPAQNMHTLPRNRNSDTQPFTDVPKQDRSHNPGHTTSETCNITDQIIHTKNYTHVTLTTQTEPSSTIFLHITTSTSGPQTQLHTHTTSKALLHKSTPTHAGLFEHIHTHSYPNTTPDKHLPTTAHTHTHTLNHSATGAQTHEKTHTLSHFHAGFLGVSSEPLSHPSSTTAPTHTPTHTPTPLQPNVATSTLSTPPTLQSPLGNPTSTPDTHSVISHTLATYTRHTPQITEITTCHTPAGQTPLTETTPRPPLTTHSQTDGMSHTTHYLQSDLSSTCTHTPTMCPPTTAPITLTHTLAPVRPDTSTPPSDYRSDPPLAQLHSHSDPLPSVYEPDPHSQSEGDSTGHNPPQRPRETSRAPDTEGAKPDGVPRQSMPELGLLLGLSAALGMAVAVGLRYLQRKYCRKRTAVSLGDRSHDNRGVIHVQECGDLVQVRRIRENSFLLLQTEYNLITAPGN